MALALHYDFATDKSLSARIGPALSITRATDANYFDDSGILQTASSNVARFDHNPVTLVSLGVLVEEAQTNVWLHNRDWTNVVYTATNITAAKDATGLDGVANSASTLTADANNGTITQTITLTSSEQTTSVWMKRKTGSGTVEITDNNFTNATDITSDINSSTWTKVGKITRTQANPVVGIRLGTSGDEVEVDFGQTEGGPINTSPIATTSSSVPRNADQPSTSDVSWLNTTVGTFYHRATSNYADDGNIDSVAFFEAEVSATQFIHSVINTSGGRTGYDSFKIRNSQQEEVTSNTNAYSAGVESQAAMAYDLDADEASLVIDGGTVATSSLFDTTEPAPDAFHVGFRGSNNLRYVNGHIAELRYYDQRLTDQQIQDMSNGIFPTGTRHLGSQLRHNAQTLRHKDTSLVHNDTSLDHKQ